MSEKKKPYKPRVGTREYVVTHPVPGKTYRVSEYVKRWELSGYLDALRRCGVQDFEVRRYA